jgi:hypothetical protein
MTPNSVRRPPVSGAQLVLALVAIAFATAVLPPAAAWALNEFRVTQTEERAGTAMERLRTTSGASSRLAASKGVVCGPGRLPDLPAASGLTSTPAVHWAWTNDARKAPELFGAGMPTDAWGRCFLVNADGWTVDSGVVWLLSAGPNGLLETPPSASTLAGDDIGVRLR